MAADADNAGGGRKGPWGLIFDHLLAPATWVAAIAAFVGFVGLVFSTCVSLLIGARVSAYSAPGDYFGIGAGLMIPGMTYVFDALAAAVYLFLLAGLAWLVVVYLLRTGIYTYRDILGARIRSAVRNKKKNSTLETRLALLQTRFDFLGEPDLGMRSVAGAGFTHSIKRIAKLLTLTSLLVIAAVFAFWIPFSEAQRYRCSIITYASASLTKPAAAVEYNEDLRCDSYRATDVNLPISNWIGTLLPGLFGEGARWIGDTVAKASEVIPIRALLAQPRLVIVSVDDQTSLRPMLTVAEYADNIILYDFLFDPDLRDQFINPTRMIGRDAAKSISSIDLRGVIYESGPENAPVSRVSRSPILAILNTACGREIDKDFDETTTDDDDIRVVRRTIAEDCLNDDAGKVQACIKNEFLDVNKLLCAPRRLVGPRAASSAEQRLTAVEEGILELKVKMENNAAQTDKIVSATVALAGFFTKVEPKLAEIGDLGIDSLIKLEKSVSDVNEALKVDIQTRSQVSNHYVVVSGGADGGRWANCEHLIGWHEDGNGIEFENAQSLLQGPNRHSLVFSRDRDTQTRSEWEVFDDILNSWIERIVEFLPPQPIPNWRPVLFLVGQASENGSVEFNLRLTEKRAAAVRKLLLQKLAQDPKKAEKLFSAGLLRNFPMRDTSEREESSIIAMGEGESMLAPASLTSNWETRRVDAELCFAREESDG